MMKTYYVRRYHIHQSSRWGIQQSPVHTDLMRATVCSPTRPVIWEWVCDGRQLSGDEVAELLHRYPLCEVLDDDDPMWRYRRAASVA